MSREITILTPENVELNFELAGLGSRFLAMFLDTLWQFLASIIPIVAVIGAVYSVRAVGLSDALEQLSPWTIAILALLLFALWSGYFLYFEATKNGQTPGKKSVGIQVIRDTGHPVDFRSATLRNLLRAVDALPGMYGIGIISIFMSPQYRRVGDYVGGTLVVKVRKEEWKTAANTQPVSAEAAPAASAQSAAHLPDELLSSLHLVTRDDYCAIRHFLDRRWDLQADVAMSLATKLAQPLAAKLDATSPDLGTPLDFLEAIAAEWERRMIR